MCNQICDTTFTCYSTNQKRHNLSFCLACLHKIHHVDDIIPS